MLAYLFLCQRQTHCEPYRCLVLVRRLASNKETWISSVLFILWVCGVGGLQHLDSVYTIFYIIPRPKYYLKLIWQ